MEPLRWDSLIARTRGHAALTTTPTTSSASAELVVLPTLTAPAASSSRTEPASSTRRDLPRFKLKQAIQPGQRSTRLAVDRVTKAANLQADNTQTRRQHMGDPIPEDDDSHDSEEDRLFELELQWLQATRGAAEPLLYTVPEFAGLA